MTAALPVGPVMEPSATPRPNERHEGLPHLDNANEIERFQSLAANVTQRYRSLACREDQLAAPV